MKRILFPFLLCLPYLIPAQKSIPSDSLYKLAIQDLNTFSHHLTADDQTNLKKANTIVNWFAENFNWTYTDYKKRSVQDILSRKGGNCSELARVTQACLEQLDIDFRQIREINLHIPTPRRQVSAEKKVAEIGKRASVFGHRHNDHVWLEIYDELNQSWVPADPSLGVVGKRNWLAARYSFNKRYSLDPTSEDMIAPFAVFAHQDGKLVSRTQAYAIEGFNELYYGQLTHLASWEKWRPLIISMDSVAMRAFNGTVNLHEHTATIAKLSGIYQSLKTEFEATDLGQIHAGIDAFSAALINGQFNELVEAYSEDAQIFPNNTGILGGREKIRQYWTPPPGQKSKTVHHRIMPEEIKILGKEAYDWGYYEGRTRREDGSEIPWRGKYVIVWKKSPEGEWKIYLDIWNRVAD